MLKYLVLLVAAFAVVHAQTMADPQATKMAEPETETEPEHKPEPEGMTEPMPEEEHEPDSDSEERDDPMGDPEHEPDGEMMGCMEDSDCGPGECHRGACRCPSNYYGMRCETHKPLKCYTCDGFVSEHSPCATGMGLTPDDVQVCTPEQTYCMSEFWHEDGVMWMKRHGCASQCWNRHGCSPDNSESCVSCCDYDNCVGYERELMAGGSDVITPSCIVISILSIATFLL